MLKSGMIALASLAACAFTTPVLAAEKVNIAYIGGTHLIDSQGQISYESPEQIHEIAQTLYTEYPQLHLYTGHCTGLQAQEIFAHILGDKFTVFHSGFSTHFQISDMG